ncbi:MAG TPA: class E sortase [Rubrobacteraceae bacterium]|nr:class E sortase [Rubrobacteraceae bacterium]
MPDVKRESYRTYKSRRRLQTRSARGKRRIFGRKSLFATGLALVLVSVGLVLISMQGAGVTDSTPAPSDDMLRLTVPKMQRAKNVPVYTASANDEQKLGAGAIRLNTTGYPWDAGSNVYIAGHRLGYPNTKSFLVFYDLNKLQNGDRVVLRDTAGTRYIYQVYNRFVTTPNDLSVTQPVGKNIVSLQTCTLPDYSQRLIVQAELVESRAKVA